MNKKTLIEIIVAALLLVIELTVFLVVRSSDDAVHAANSDVYLTALMVILINIDLYFIIALQIINSDDNRLVKSIIAAVLFVVELVVVLALRFGDDFKNAKNADAYMTALFAIFVAILVFCIIAFQIVATIENKSSKETSDK